MSAQPALADAPPARRGLLWPALVLLVLGLLALLVFLAARYEASAAQRRAERDAAEAVGDIRAGLTRNLQSLQVLQAASVAGGGARWHAEATALLRTRREWLRIELRDPDLALREAVDTPFRAPAYEVAPRGNAPAELRLACAAAERLSQPAYAQSTFVPGRDGIGIEAMDLCIPLADSGRPVGYLVASYGLPLVLGELVGPALARGQEVSFTEADGTRLALHGRARRGADSTLALQLLDLPNHTMVLRLEHWRTPASTFDSLFPNVLTALVAGMALALVAVLALLAKDQRRRQRAEMDLAEALAFRKAMEDSLVTGLRARDLEGRITYVNPAFCDMTGFGAAELRGRGTPAPFWPPEHVDDYLQRQAVRFAGRLPPPREGFESVFMRRDGTRFPVLIIEAPLIDARGLHTGWMGAVLDLSEQRRVEELQRASQERLQATARLATVGEMASLLSHELNQPLAAISSYATGSLNVLDDAGPAAAPLRMPLLRIAEQAERAGRVIRSVHGFVRRRDQTRIAVAPAELVEAIGPLVRLQARKLGIRVQVDCDAALPAAWCDRTMVEQVLLNLARNAMQAMEHTPAADRLLRIAVRAVARGWLAFSVADHGGGIAPDVAARLFTPFFTTKAEGMGLGLSLCRTVVEQHGGVLEHAPAEGGGTVFTFTLPISPQEAP